MKRNIIFLMMLTLFAFTACNDDDDDKGSISPISDVTATPNIGSVVLKWTNPAQSDYYYTLVEYQNAAGETVKTKISRYAVDAEAGENHTKATIFGFEDENNYTFTLTAYNVNGATSTPVTVSATPQAANMAYYYVVNSVNVTPRLQGGVVSWVNEWDVPIFVNISYTDSKGITQTKRVPSSSTDSVSIASFVDPTTIKVTTESAKGDVSSERQIQVTPIAKGEFDPNNITINSISSVWQDGYEGEKMLDRKLDTYWHTVLTGYPHWVVFDLGANYYVNWLELVRRAADGGNETAAPKKIKWEYSTDGTTFTELGEFDFDISLQFNHTYNFTTPFYGRYIKLTCLEGNNGWAHMAEFLAYYADKADHYADEAAAEVTPAEPDPDDDMTIDPNVEYLTPSSTVNNEEITVSSENEYEFTIQTTGGDSWVHMNGLKKEVAGTVLVFYYQVSEAVNSEFFWCDKGGGPAGGRETHFTIPANKTGEWKTFKVNLAEGMNTHNWAGNVGDFVRFDTGDNPELEIKIKNMHFRAAREDE